MIRLLSAPRAAAIYRNGERVLVASRLIKGFRMGFLAVTRREGEEIRLTIDPDVDTDQLLRHLLRDGITVHIGSMGRSQVKVSVEAPAQMQILRTELETRQR